MIKVANRLLTIEEFRQLPDPIDGSKQELVAGEVWTVPPPSFNHGRAQVLFSSLLSVFVEEHELGQVTTESGMITERDPDSLRGPDIAYWSKERVPLDEVIANYPDESPDICVEILSEPRRKKALKRKLKEYFANDVRLVWVVNLEERTVTEYTAVRKSRVLTEKDIIMGGSLIPGFQCRVTQVLPRRKVN